LRIKTPRLTKRKLRELRRLQITPEAREKLFAGARPFDCDAWRRERGPATPEGLAEMEDFLRELREERAASKARDAPLLKAAKMRRRGRRLRWGRG
jgi:hypothetical protein